METMTTRILNDRGIDEQPAQEVLRRVRLLLTGGVVVAGAAVLALGVMTWAASEGQALIVVVLLAVTAQKLDFGIYGDRRISVAFVPIFAGTILLGLPGLVAAGGAAALVGAFRGDRSLFGSAYQVGSQLVAGGIALFILRAGGVTASEQNWPVALGPVVLAAGAQFVVASGLIAADSLPGRHGRLRSVWNEQFSWLLPYHLALGVLGLTLASAYTEIGMWGMLAFVVPPLMIQVSLQHHLDRTAKALAGLHTAHDGRAAVNPMGLERAEGDLSVAVACLRDAYGGTVRSLMAALDARDRDTKGHSERVAELAVEIAAEMGIAPDSEESRHIHWGSLLHDVGKIAVPDAILRKPSDLSEEEWERMRTHPRAGYEMLQSIDFLAPAAEIVLAHHERYDGAGYPGGLSGEEIPLGARIFAVADTFDAITADRTYRAGVSAEEALAEIVRNSGKQFDPAAVRAFLRMYERRLTEDGFGRVPRSPLSESLRSELVETAAIDEL